MRAAEIRYYRESGNLGPIYEDSLRLHPGKQTEWDVICRVTSDLVGRVWQHRNGTVEGFTKRHGVHRLVWYEVHECMESAISRERSLKKWNRAWKIQLIEELNPFWMDLYDELS